MTAPTARPTALICIGRGIGDIIQTTPLIRAVASLGYAVDLWMAADYPEAVTLLEGWPAVRGIITSSTEVDLSRYDEVIMTLLFPYARFFYRRPVRVVRLDRKDRRHRVECDMVHARDMGYRGPTPATYARTSSRRFDVPEQTIALHPGSSPAPYNLCKRWPRFPELARMLLHAGLPVAVVGSSGDGPLLSDWPDGIVDFRGALDLLDTGALLSECRAVVSNDSGIAHLAAAVDTPTLAIFGPTSEQLYAPFAPHAQVVATDISCRPCRNPERCRHRRCLTDLPPRMVEDRLITLLGRQRRKGDPPDVTRRAVRGSRRALEARSVSVLAIEPPDNLRR